MRAVEYRDKDTAPGTRELPRDEGFAWGILPEQFERAAELSPEQRLHLAGIMQAVDDWKDLFTRGHFVNEHGSRTTRSKIVQWDALTLRDFIFDDGYGMDDPNFISIRQICLALSIDLTALRGALRSIGAPEDMKKLPLFTKQTANRRRKGQHLKAAA